jgi:uncharacterized protein YjiS (DUF1127 family)
MTAHVVKDEIAIMNPGRLAHYFQDEPGYIGQTAPKSPSILARISGVLRRLADIPRRQAVMEELGALSDHELADIGLSRSDLPFVFDGRFVAERNAERRAARA